MAGKVSGSSASEAKKRRVDKALRTVFFEKQDGALCGQHCLNNALQDRVFSAVDLSDIAKQLDEREKQTMAECGTHTAEYRDFLAKPSQNFDDTGYFSVQVLSEALKNMGLELVSLRSEDERATYARQNLIEQRLIIVNMADHWFALRRFGPQWLNLNSTLGKPETYTDTYFGMYMQTLQNDGHTLFLVFGNIPDNMVAEEAFTSLLVDEPEEFAAMTGPGNRLGGDPTPSDTSQAAQDANTQKEKLRQQREAFLARLEGNK